MTLLSLSRDSQSIPGIRKQQEVSPQCVMAIIWGSVLEGSACWVDTPGRMPLTVLKKRSNEVSRRISLATLLAFHLLFLNVQLLFTEMLSFLPFPGLSEKTVHMPWSTCSWPMFAYLPQQLWGYGDCSVSGYDSSLSPILCCLRPTVGSHPVSLQMIPVEIPRVSPSSFCHLALVQSDPFLCTCTALSTLVEFSPELPFRSCHHPF